MSFLKRKWLDVVSEQNERQRAMDFILKSDQAVKRLNARITQMTSTDDDEPITREWVTEEYGVSHFCITPDIDVYIVGQVILEISRDKLEFATLDHIKTRGQFRALITGLGWSTNKPG